MSNQENEQVAWRSLFNGENFEGWRGYNRADIPGKWSVEQGLMKISATGSEGCDSEDGGDIIFDQQFANFELELEWMVSKGGNSGIFYLGQEVAEQPIYISAPEYQILDNANHPDANLGIKGNRMSASLYDMIPAEPQNQRPYGEWNLARIIVQEGKVSHYQNDVLVLQYELWSPAWQAMLDASKFSKEAWPLAYDLLLHCGGEAKAGYIGLQDHGDDVWFRNIRLREY